MNFKRYTVIAPALAALLALAAGCTTGPGVTGGFDRDFTVTGHNRLEVSTAAGDINVTGSADGKIHVHGQAHVSGSDVDDARKRLSDLTSNPPIEQTADGVRIGKDLMHLRNTTVSYDIQVPRDTEVVCTSASGSEVVRNVQGPLKMVSVSGSVTAEGVAGEAQLSSISGSVNAANMGDIVRATSVTGDITVNGAKGDVRAKLQSGSIKITNPGARVEADDTSGNIYVEGATSDAKAHTISGRVTVKGNPSTSDLWDLKTTSGTVDIGIAAGSNFHLLAESGSGEIRADVPIMIEEQGKHSMRAQIGSGGGRVEVHTLSGEIHLSPF